MYVSMYLIDAEILNQTNYTIVIILSFNYIMQMCASSCGWIEMAKIITWTVQDWVHSARLFAKESDFNDFEYLSSLFQFYMKVIICIKIICSIKKNWFKKSRLQFYTYVYYN